MESLFVGTNFTCLQIKTITPYLDERFVLIVLPAYCIAKRPQTVCGKNYESTNVTDHIKSFFTSP